MTTPTENPIALVDPPQHQEGKNKRGRSAAELADARALKATRRLEDEAKQAAQTETVEGYTLRPAIGKTGGVDNVGWELIPPQRQTRDHNPTWYLRNRQEALEAIPRHRETYGR